MQEVVVDAPGAATRESNRGVLISRVLSGSPAAAAGLERGDIILEWNKHQVADSRELFLGVGRTAVNSKVEVLVLRGEEQITLQVTVGERPAQMPRP
jgi:serine protease Do